MRKKNQDREIRELKKKCRNLQQKLKETQDILFDVTEEIAADTSAEPLIITTPVQDDIDDNQLPKNTAV